MNTLSTENLKLIPSPIHLKQICKSIAALEAIICQEWEYRYYSYQKEWSPTEECFQMRDGSGDEMFILFSADGVCINGFAHESEMSGWKHADKTKLTLKIWPGVVDELPNVFKKFILGEPIKSIGTTFCIWQTKNDTEWKRGTIKFPPNEYKDGSSELLQLLDGNAGSYKAWAEEYYIEELDEKELHLEPIESIYHHEIITPQLALKINPALEDFEQLKADLDEIGYQHNL